MFDVANKTDSLIDYITAIELLYVVVCVLAERAGTVTVQVGRARAYVTNTYFSLCAK